MNIYCHCITIPLKNKTFKLLRIDLLFDKNEYNQLINNDNKYRVGMNVILYDHNSSMWSGVQFVNIINDKINSYNIIPKISVCCSQTLIKKSVNIIGSMAWQISPS